MKKSVSILTALIMAVTMMFSGGAAVFAAEDNAPETGVSAAVREGAQPGEPVPGNSEEALVYAARGTETAGQTVYTCTISVTRNYDYAFAVLDLVNQERAKAGLNPVKMNKTLMDAAMLRAAETAMLWSHMRPTGERFYTVSSLAYAENIAYGQSSPESVMYAWMNSTGHRAAILTSNYKSIGIGVVIHNGGIYWVQEFGFGSQSSNCAKPASGAAKYNIKYVTNLYDEGEKGLGNITLQPALYVDDTTMTPGQVIWAQMKMVNKGSNRYCVLDNSGITWSTSDSSYLKIDSTGKATALKEGCADINAKTGGKTYYKSIVITAPNKVVSSHVDKPVTLYFSSAYDEEITIPAEYGTVNVISKTPYEGAYNYKVEVTFKKGMTSQAVSVKGANSKTLMLLAATVSNHSYKDQTGTPATCTTPGKTAGKICTICYQTTGEPEEIPALGHDIIIKEAVPATCASTGRTEGQWCQRCYTTIVAQQTIPKTDHDMVVTNNPDGSRVESCKNCTYKITYSGSITPDNPSGSTADVTRIYGSDRYQTSFKAANQLKEELGVSKFKTIIVAYGGNYADALAGSYLAAKKDAPILLINGKKSGEVTDYIRSNLKSGGTVYVLGGEAAVKTEWMNGLDFIRLGGSDRYETNIMILDEAGIEQGCKLMVCTGKGFADSLSVSATGYPIMLVGKQLSSRQKSYMGTLDIDTCYLIGGTAAVSKSVQTDCLRYSNVRRLNGSDRYETSVLVGYYLFNNPSRAVLAYSMNFPDGLSAGPLAYNMNAPLILTKTGKEYRAWEYIWTKNITSGYILGGPGLISDSSVRTIFTLSGSYKINVK